MSGHRDLLAALLPPVSYDPNAPQLAADLVATGAVLDSAQANGLATLDAITPDGDLSMLADWERVYGLPDEALGSNQTIDQRLAMLLERINETGRMDRDEFLFVATRLGFSCSLTEFNPWRVDTPIEQPLFSDDWMFVWQLNASAPSALLEAVMRRIAPAHTILQFSYGGNPGLLMLEDGSGFLITEHNDYVDLS